MEHTEGIKIMLETLPDKIMKKERLILDKSDSENKLDLETKSTEISYERQIADELEEVPVKNKEGNIEYKKQKKCKNELERKRELDIRIARNDIYNSKIKNLIDLRIEIKEDNIMLGYLKRRFQCACNLARLANE